MSEIELPEVINNFILASNEHNTEAMLVCFTNEAVLSDDNREFKGIASIKQWSDKEYIGSRVKVEVLDIALRGMVYLISTEINGDYPNPPYYFDYSFTLHANQIAKMQITES